MNTVTREVAENTMKAACVCDKQRRQNTMKILTREGLGRGSRQGGGLGGERGSPL